MTKESSRSVERWDLFELDHAGPTDGNPFVDVTFGAEFRQGARVVDCAGFYDGDGSYKVRFMPDSLGAWTYRTRSDCAQLDGREGTFECVEPAESNHGPISPSGQFHFAYADGSPFRQIGTTCYAWIHQGDELAETTLETLRAAPFNKLRMCVFPKDYTFSRNEPVYHPFEGSGPGAWDFTRFNPEFFRNLERRVGDLRDLGIEADVILFHPYDRGRWGYDSMDSESDDRYLRYVVARLAAYRNVWWSMANEWDLLDAKSESDWDRFFKIVQTCDPCQHPRSIHNCRIFYDHGKPWVTHCSIQRPDPSQSVEWRKLYGKPVVDDECCYEGNLKFNWGNIPAQELVRRFWDGYAAGGYVGHGETYMHEKDILWWSKGGVLHGQSPARLAFLRKIMEEGPARFEPCRHDWNTLGCWDGKGDWYLQYLGITQPAVREMHLPEDREYNVDIIDTWEMTVTELDGTYSGRCEIPLPGKQYIAMRARSIT
jgi:uncharacterized protein DUF5605/uncharacterized protein DUF5060/uncharacterized protein DUF4038